MIGAAALANGPNWQTACDDGLCVFRHDVAAPEGEGTSALFEILVDAETATASIIITTPLGVALEPDIRILTGTREWRAPIKVCHGDGCRATIDLDDDDLAFLLQQRDATIRYHVFGAATDTALQLSLTGLVSAITSRSR